MLFVTVHRIRNAQIFLKNIRNRVETAVAVPRKLFCNTSFFIRQQHFRVYAVVLPIVHLRHRKICLAPQIRVEEKLVKLGGLQFLMPLIRNIFDDLRKGFLQPRGKMQLVLAFENKRHAALSRLTVDADDVLFIFSADIPRIDRQVRNVPYRLGIFFPIAHTLGDSVLMRSRKRGKYHFPRVGLPGGNLHPGKIRIHGRRIRQIFKIQLRIHPV